MGVYKTLLRPILFRLDSERAHELVLRAGEICSAGPFPALIRGLWGGASEGLRCEVFGLQFPSPVGVAAGFDKECRIVPALGSIGFGFVEIGTVTGRPQPGNPRPRIFRLREDQALINRMGFPSEGADAVSERLLTLRKRGYTGIVGVNIGKTKAVSIDDALQDYLYSFEKLSNGADYFVINVSSPNTPDLRKLQERSRLTTLLKGLQDKNTKEIPLLVKVAPDLSREALEELLECCFDCNVAGIVATNTTFSREGLRSDRRSETGGLSGKPLFAKALEFVTHIVRTTAEKLPVIGVGGIHSAETARQMIDAGASLVQVYTGMIYNGPLFVRTLNNALATGRSSQITTSQDLFKSQ